MPAPTTLQIATLALNLRAWTHSNPTGPISDSQIARTVDTVVDLYDDGMHDEWDDESAKFTALDVLETLLIDDAQPATYVDLVAN